MSGFDAYLSFANYLKEQLAGSGITVTIEKTNELPYPYLLIQDGPDELEGWISRRLIQGWLVVQKEESRPLVETMGRALRFVQEATQDPGHLTKYSYATDPPVTSGSLIPVITEITGPIPTNNDFQLMRKIITWELTSNCK